MFAGDSDQAFLDGLRSKTHKDLSNAMIWVGLWSFLWQNYQGYVHELSKEDAQSQKRITQMEVKRVIKIKYSHIDIRTWYIIKSFKFLNSWWRINPTSTFSSWRSWWVLKSPWLTGLPIWTSWPLSLRTIFLLATASVSRLKDFSKSKKSKQSGLCAFPLTVSSS